MTRSHHDYPAPSELLAVRGDAAVPLGEVRLVDPVTGQVLVRAVNVGTGVDVSALAREVLKALCIMREADPAFTRHFLETLQQDEP